MASSASALFIVAFLYATPILPQANQATQQLCTFASSGSFNSSLLSITWGTSKWLRFILSTGKYISVHSSTISQTSIDLTNTTKQVLRRFDAELRCTDRPMKQCEPLKGYYEFLSGYEVGGLMLTKTMQYMIDWKHGKRLLWQKPREEKYSIVYAQDVISVFGYVFRMDTIDGTGNLIIHQLWLDAKLNISVEPNPTDRHFFFIESVVSNVLSLVHRTTRKLHPAGRHNLLFSKLPRGFILGDQMHLFDDDRGCVFLINLKRLDLAAYFKEGKNWLVERINVPYERYFSCPNGYQPDGRLDANRCDVTGLPPNPRLDPEDADNWETNPPAGTEEPGINYPDSTGGGLGGQWGKAKRNSMKPQIYIWIAAGSAAFLLLIGLILWTRKHPEMGEKRHKKRAHKIVVVVTKPHGNPSASIATSGNIATTASTSTNVTTADSLSPSSANAPGSTSAYKISNSLRGGSKKTVKTRSSKPSNTSSSIEKRSTPTTSLNSAATASSAFRGSKKTLKTTRRSNLNDAASVGSFPLGTRGKSPFSPMQKKKVVAVTTTASALLDLARRGAPKVPPH